MSVKSILKGIGKVALKVAPYAAMAIPGVGVPLGMAIKGGIGAAQGAMNGGGIKGALLGGGLGAAGGAAGSVLSKIGPSSGLLSKVLGGAAGKTAGTGVAGKVGGVLGNVASSALGRQGPLLDTSAATGGGNIKNAIGNAVENMGNDYINSRASSRGLGPSSAQASASSAVPRAPMQTGNAPGFQYGINNPNLADSILAGRRNAVASQPFRAGYDITRPSIPNNPNSPVNILAHMPQIPSDFGPTRNRRPRQQAAQ